MLIDPALTDGAHTVAMDGQPWERLETMAAIQKMVAAEDLPHLQAILMHFLKGTLRTWEKFTAEFVKGGVIDSLSPAEREAVWIMPTNDHNKGILGGEQIWTRENPNGSEATFNAEKKAQHNETEEFIAEHLNTKEDECMLRGKAHDMEPHETAGSDGGKSLPGR